jgi:hypothetical protein
LQKITEASSDSQKVIGFEKVANGTEVITDQTNLPENILPLPVYRPTGSQKGAKTDAAIVGSGEIMIFQKKG